MSKVKVPLGSVTVINPGMKKGISPNTPCSFLPMEAINEQDGKIYGMEVRNVSDVIKGYTPFEENDVLFAKITPCMENGKAAIAKDLANGIGFGSTEFHVIRAGKGILPEWIFYFLRRKSFREFAERRMRGSAGQKRVPDDFLAEVDIVLPDQDEQLLTIQCIKKVEHALKLCRAAREQTQSLFVSTFLELFGDPFVNPKNFPLAKLSELGELDRGRSKHRPRNAPHLYGGPYPFIQTGDVANADGYVRGYKQTYSDSGLKQSKLWPAGTLCITIAANIGKTAILTFPACFPDSIVGFSPSAKTRTEYVQYWLVMVQEHIERTAPESAQKNINLEILDELLVPVPPISLQEDFSKFVRVIEKTRLRVLESERQTNFLLQSLMEKSFSDVEEREFQLV